MTANRCLTYVSVSHVGAGWVQGCVSILEAFPRDVLRPTLVLPRTFRPIAPTVNVTEALPRPLPLRYASSFVQPALSYRFRRALSTADPQKTIAYFWPTAPTSLVRHARKLGFLTVREMINPTSRTTKTILDEAYDRLDLQGSERRQITDEKITDQQNELQLFDYIVSCNARVEASLIEGGVESQRILRSSFGWSPARLARSSGEQNRQGFRALFVGGETVRKGVPQLIAAWRKSGVVGELLIVGDIQASIRSLLAPDLEKSDIRLIKYESDLGSLYKSADVFVFPSLAEGDPQVTYEAAGCGLPVIATPMGSAQIIRDGVNGLVVGPYDIDGLAEAISRLARSPELRRRLGQQAAKDALDFTYDKIGKRRAAILSGLLPACTGRAAAANGA